jgi:hypothetical protein
VPPELDPDVEIAVRAVAGCRKADAG